jgi:hypothetical protein
VSVASRDMEDRMPGRRRRGRGREEWGIYRQGKEGSRHEPRKEANLLLLP